jgi:4-amino-4-deoxy-L-arabinose transferase-like glycosyltransferase
MQNTQITIHLGRDRSFQFSETFILTIILILGGLLRFVALGRWSLWTDELYNLGLMPVSALLSDGIPADQHPPLYYLLLEQVLKLGRSEWLMRLPSALAGFLTIPIMWRIGAALKRPNIGLLAAALIAFAPLHIWYSREARMYGLAMFFWVAAIYFYIQSWQRDNWLDTLGLVLVMTGGLYTAYPTLALWFIQMALFFLFWRLCDGQPIRLVRWLLAQLAVAALFYAWWPFLQRQLDRPTVFDWLNFFESALGPETAEQLSQWLEQRNLTTTLAGTFQLAVVAGLVFVLVSLLLSLIVVRWRSIISLVKRWEFPIAIIITFIFLALTAAGAIPRGLSLRRQLLVFWVPFIILAAWAIIQLKNKWLLAAAVGLSLLLSLYTAFGPAYEDWRSAVVVVEEHSQPGDLILITPTWSTAAFDYYYEGDLFYTGTNLQHARQNEPALIQAPHVWLVFNRHPALAVLTLETEN